MDVGYSGHRDFFANVDFAVEMTFGDTLAPSATKNLEDY